MKVTLNRHICMSMYVFRQKEEGEEEREKGGE